MDTQRRIHQGSSTEVITNTRWQAGSIGFIVENVVTEPSGKIWVYYYNEKTLQKYNCLIDAFTSRFYQDFTRG
jgi:hypothetical protein